MDILDEETVKIALIASSPVPTTPEGNMSASWWSSSYSGTFERAHNPKESYFPLYTTQTLQPNARRDSSNLDASENTTL